MFLVHYSVNWWCEIGVARPSVGLSPRLPRPAVPGAPRPRRAANGGSALPRLRPRRPAPSMKFIAALGEKNEDVLNSGSSSIIIKLPERMPRGERMQLGYLWSWPRESPLIISLSYDL